MGELTEDVCRYLDKVAAEDQPVPSLRTIRNAVGRGSLTTISEAVKQWRKKQMIDEGVAPETFTEKESKALSEAIWNIVLPKCQQLLERERGRTQKLVGVDLAEANKIRAEADKVFEAAEKKIEKNEALIEKLRGEIRTLEAMNERLQVELAAEKQTVKAMHEVCNKAMAERDTAIKTAAAAEATTATLKKLMPMLDLKDLKRI